VKERMMPRLCRRILAAAARRRPPNENAEPSARATDQASETQTARESYTARAVWNSPSAPTPQSCKGRFDRALGTKKAIFALAIR
jgi:hypothetical protein